MRSLLLEAVDLFGDAQSGYIPGCGHDLEWIKRRNSFFEDATETPNVKLRGDPPALSAERPSRMEGSAS
jgi:hypothetical protein